MRKVSLRARIVPMLAALVLLSGCKSPQGPGSDSLAAVEVQGHGFLEVAKAVSNAFQHAGFQPAPVAPNNNMVRMLVFEKRGAKGDGVLYGDWSTSEIWYRAKVYFTTTGPNNQLVTCDAYRVLEKGSRFFEEQHKVSKRGVYQDILDKAKASLLSAKPAEAR